MNQRLVEPIDKTAIAVIFIFSILIGLLVWGGNACGRDCLFHTGPKVVNFSWQNKLVGGEDRAFVLTFNRPMDRSSVEENLVINPPLPGKFSWSGRRLAYTVATPVPYGKTYQVQLAKAKEKFAGGNSDGEEIRPFVGEFRSRDRAFVYIGSKGEEKGRLILHNWTKQTKTILTPANLIVFEFKPYPQGERILFSAAEKSSGDNALISLQLYTVTTGLNQTLDRPETQEIELILDNKQYQNNKFDLSQDGKAIVVQRVNRQDPNDFGLWLIAENKQPQPLKDFPGGDFSIAPDSKTIAVAQGEGIALLPLQPDAEPLDFLAKFGRVITFSPDGSSAIMVNYNKDNPDLRYTRSLFYVNNLGVEKELLNLEGSILDCKFHPNQIHLYCLLTKLEKVEEYREKPYLAKIHLQTGETVPILTLPEYQDSKISMAPDGKGILFDQILTSDSVAAINVPTNNSGKAIIDSRLWLLIPSSTKVHRLEELPLAGFHPQWVP